MKPTSQSELMNTGEAGRQGAAVLLQGLGFDAASQHALEGFQRSCGQGGIAQDGKPRIGVFVEHAVQGAIRGIQSADSRDVQA